MRNWQNELQEALPSYSHQLTAFIEDTDKGFQHSLEVFNTSMQLVAQIPPAELNADDIQAIEHLAVFHDIGKFFQELHDLGNLKIAQSVYVEFAQHAGIPRAVKNCS